MAAVLFTGTQILRSQSGVIGIAYVRASNYSDTSLSKAFNLTQLKRGTGGRCSFNGVVATVFGATGFLGRYVVNKLGKIGSQVIIPYRGDIYDCQRLKVAGDLGQILFFPYDVRDQTSIEKAVKYSNVVINLVGRDWETKNFSMIDVHVTAARNIALAAKAAGVQKFIHLSALNCTPHPTPYFVKGGSKFYSSKYHGEQAVRDAFPEAVILRPSDIYGQEDRFLKYYSHGWRREGNWIPLYKAGEDTIKQPVFCGDVAEGIVNAIKDPDADGKVFQAVGPRRYKLGELVDWFSKLTGRYSNSMLDYYRYDVRLNPFFLMKMKITDKFLPGFPIGFLSQERFERECHTDIVERSLPTLEDLGVNVRKMEDQVPWELRPYLVDLYERLANDVPLPNPMPPIDMTR